MVDLQLKELLHSKKKISSRADCTPYLNISLVDAQVIAQRTNLPLLAVECAALREDILPERYSRNQKTLSCADQLRLFSSHVAVIGLGGLGGTVVELLARLGVGHLTLVDGDVFDESNINRQLLCSPLHIGQDKARVAETRLQEINPAVELRIFPEFFTANNGSAILSEVDLAVDCLDNIPSRFLLEKMCRETSIPLVSAAIAGASGQATTIFPSDSGFKLIYGKQEKIEPKGVEKSLGTLPFAAAYMAAVESAEVMNILLGKPAELRHRLFLAEINEHTSELLELISK